MEEVRLVEILLTPKSLSLAAAIVALLFFIGKLPIKLKEHGNKTLENDRYWRRLLPIITPILGIIVAFLPGVADIPLDQWGSLIIFGLWTSFMASHGRKIIKRAIFDKIKDDNEKV